MLIRSQDKLAICNLENVDTICNSYSTNSWDTRVEISSFNQSERTVLGYYKTKERTIEVLDEICNAYQYCNECVVTGFGALQPEFVYQMPEE